MLALLLLAILPPSGDIADKLRGGLLGQVLGDLNGLAHENKYVAAPGDVRTYTPALPDGAWTDDDTDIEWVYVVDLERGSGLFLPPARIAALWRRHINRRIWCSHAYLRQLLEIGIEPPLTGSVHLNPWAEFNLSGQFVSETWGLIAPGRPRTAARLAAHYTHVSVDGEPVQSAQMFAAMVATAYLTGDIGRILDAGAAAADPRSAMHHIMADVRGWAREHPDDWRATRRLIQQRWSVGQRTADLNGVKLNGAAAIAALLYGRGDFRETVRHAFNFGWDADNNAAAAGAIVGVMRGARWMQAQGWALGDAYRNTSRDGMPMDETLTRFGDRLLALSRRLPGGVEQAANVERLADPARQLTTLRRRLRPEIERGLAGGGLRDRARAAYLAIALELAPELRRTRPAEWERAVAALQAHMDMIKQLFAAPATATGDRLRAQALAAGLVRP